MNTQDIFDSLQDTLIDMNADLSQIRQVLDRKETIWSRRCKSIEKDMEATSEVGEFNVMNIERDICESMLSFIRIARKKLNKRFPEKKVKTLPGLSGDYALPEASQNPRGVLRDKI